MKLSDEKLKEILREALTECGEQMPQHQEHYDEDHSLEDMVDMLSKNVEPVKIGHGGKSKMARGHLYHIANRSQSLHDRLADDDELPEWVQSKLAVAESMVNAVYDHLDYKLHSQTHDEHESDLSEIHKIVNEAGVEKLANSSLIQSLKKNAAATVKKIPVKRNRKWAESMKIMMNAAAYDPAKFEKLVSLIKQHGANAEKKAKKQAKGKDAGIGSSAGDSKLAAKRAGFKGLSV